eukprot:1146338-Pelagomonas_calceolata.AAC.3
MPVALDEASMQIQAHKLQKVAVSDVRKILTSYSKMRRKIREQHHSERWSKRPLLMCSQYALYISSQHPLSQMHSICNALRRVTADAA